MVHIVMEISGKQATRILNLYQTTKHIQLMLQKNLLKMLIIRFHFDSAKCFLTNYSYMWCATLIPARFCVFKVNNRNIRRRPEICSNLTVRIPDRHQLMLF